jgi:hypothetical protein
MQDLVDNESSYANFENLGFWQESYNAAVAVTVFFCWVKIFKYLSFNKTMAQVPIRR